MRVRVWNAYASNNSGSYTIVGRLPSAEVAESTACELREMIDAHTAWIQGEDDTTEADDSPLAQFCRKHGLTWSKGDGFRDDWPQFSDDNRPGVVVCGKQIIVHHPYTVTLPPTFGELFYKKGGRVLHEEDHAHYPIVVSARFYWGWTEEERALESIELPRLLADLTAPDGVLERCSRRDWPPAWRAAGGVSGVAPLSVGAVFDDLLAGVAALRVQAEAHSARLELRLAEAASNERDPLVHLRPSTPTIARFDVVVTDVGADRSALIEALARATGQYESEVSQRFRQQPPLTVARALLEVRARSLASALEGAGARIELRRNDA